jgi:hypothetical protein
MRFILGALAAATLLVGVAAWQPAEARCFWNGYGWQCWHHSHHYWGGWRHHYRPYGWWY